jgi:hypothetical protein
MKKTINIPKDYFKNVDFKIQVPTIICVCGKEILDTPTNRARVEILKNTYRVTLLA